MTPSYYVFPGLKLAYLTPEQLEGIKKHNTELFNSDEVLSEVRKCVCEYYNVTREQLEGRRGKGVLPWARHVFIYLCRKYTRMTYVSIGDLLNRDHSTAMHSCRTVRDQIDSYKEFRSQLLIIENNIEDKVFSTLKINKRLEERNNETH